MTQQQETIPKGLRESEAPTGAEIMSVLLAEAKKYLRSWAEVYGPKLPEYVATVCKAAGIERDRDTLVGEPEERKDGLRAEAKNSLRTWADRTTLLPEYVAKVCTAGGIEYGTPKKTIRKAK